MHTCSPHQHQPSTLFPDTHSVSERRIKCSKGQFWHRFYCVRLHDSARQLLLMGALQLCKSSVESVKDALCLKL